MFTYKAFGLIINSTIEIPEFVEIHIDNQKNRYDVKVQFGKTDKTFLNNKNRVVNEFFEKTKNQFLLKKEDIAYFFIEDGNLISIEPQRAPLDLKSIRIFLASTCMSVILHQRGILSIHGSSLILNDKVTLFIGSSGAGKSTTLSHFIQKGYQTIGDDIQPVVWKEDSPVIIPAIPSIKLWDDALKFLPINDTLKKSELPQANKYRVSLEQQFKYTSLPLERCVLLYWDDVKEIEVFKASQTEAMLLYRNNIYRKGLNQLDNEKKKFFKFVEKISKTYSTI